MKYYDLAEASAFTKHDPGLLGYAAIAGIGTDFIVSEKHVGNTAKPSILYGKEPGMFMRSLHSNSTAFFCFDDFEAMNKVVAAASETGKPILIPVSRIFSKDKPQELRSIARARRLVSVVLEYDATPILATMASNKNQLLSSLQLFEVGVMLGFPEKNAKEAMSKLGDLID